MKEGDYGIHLLRLNRADSSVCCVGGKGAYSVVR